MEEDYEIFEERARLVREVAEPFIAYFYGDRCPDYEESCLCCRAWRQLDELLDNPFKE